MLSATAITRFAGSNKNDLLKYLCLGYIEPGKFEGMTADERHAVLDECFEYNDHLRANGHLDNPEYVRLKRFPPEFLRNDGRLDDNTASPACISKVLATDVVLQTIESMDQ